MLTIYPAQQKERTTLRSIGITTTIFKIAEIHNIKIDMDRLSQYSTAELDVALKHMVDCKPVEFIGLCTIAPVPVIMWERYNDVQCMKKIIQERGTENDHKMCVFLQEVIETHQKKNKNGNSTFTNSLTDVFRKEIHAKESVIAAVIEIIDFADWSLGRDATCEIIRKHYVYSEVW